MNLNADSRFNRYLESTRILGQVEARIPLASQTFSKSRTQYPPKISPLFVTHSLGCSTWDIDGNEYVDLVSSLAAVTLGYGDPEVNKAVSEQLALGVTLSLPSLLEFEVAELIGELVPSAEKVRFAKTGSDATAGAIRLARAFTNREHVLLGGYHGWQDWYIGSTSMHLGVPESVQKLSHPFVLNDIDAFEKLLTQFKGNIAAVILEPISYFSPTQEFLNYLRERTIELGIILIFDETVTGFRVAPGGAQELLSITPDLTTFGKGIANGFPLSVLCGRADIMNLMDRIFFSGTFGGELLSLAAAKVVLKKIRDESVTQTLASIGERLNIAVNKVLHDLNFQGLTLSGHPSWQFLVWNEKDFKDLSKARTLFMQEMFFEGVLILGSHNLTLAHNENAINTIASAYQKVLTRVQQVESDQNYSHNLLVEPLKPLFKVR
jgi:glutamate-1-semialdehyde 2,1-aminomutase